MKSGISILIWVSICLFTVFSQKEQWQNKVFKYDVSGYHLYLPAVFIYTDIGNLSFYQHINNTYTLGIGNAGTWYEIYDQPNGKKLNKYPVGVSVMELPFFLIAHIFNIIFNLYPADGYSLPYQYGTICSTIFWVTIGLLYLRRFLVQYYSDSIVFLTLLMLALGTNLYFYTAYGPGMCHPYSFTLFSIALYYTDKWYQYYKRKHLTLLAVAFGLICIVRPVDIIFILIPLLWKVESINDFKSRMIFLYKHIKDISLAFIPFFLIILIQLSYWKYITGHWLVYTYGKEHFLWKDPEIWKGLFGFRKGWFIYSPLAFIALTGFITLWKTHRKLVPSLILYLVITVYVTFSWWSWWYGGSFGARPMIDSLPVLALPFAALADYIYHRRSIILYSGFSVLIVFFLLLNMFQSYQYSKNIIHYDRMTFRYYWRVFGKTHADEKDYELLLDDKTYWNDMRRIDK